MPLSPRRNLGTTLMLRKAVQLIDTIRALGVDDEQVLNVMGNIDRTLFLPPTLSHKAYENNALPIGQGQTLSQPYTVARMSTILRQHMLNQAIVEPKILEIGTGSGFQTAVLTQLFTHVFSIERIKALQFQARRRLQHLDCYNFSLKHGDGWQGWAAKGPFDGIIVTAAAATLPEKLLTQLSEQGCLLIPVGETEQHLYLYQRDGDTFSHQIIEAVKFVPLVPGDLL